jgi:hypothetical protein
MSGRGPSNLYAVEWRDRLAKPQVTLVAADTHAYALQAVEEEAPGQIVQQPSIRRLHTGQSDSHDYASIIWSGGTPLGGR